MSDHSVIAESLWKDYGYTLPDSPGSMAHGILLALRQNGYMVSHINAEKTPSQVEIPERGV